MSNEEPKYLYRFVDNYDREESALLLLAFPVIRVTPKGFWIGQSDYSLLAFPFNQREKFVLAPRGYSKRFAYADKKEALHSYTERKRWQVKRLQRQLERAKSLLTKAKAGFEGPYLWPSGSETWRFKPSKPTLEFVK